MVGCHSVWGGIMKTIGIRVMLIVAAASLAWAQAISTSQINGTVQDGSGLAVPGAQIKATQTETGLVRNVMSGVDGSFILTSLPVGPYQLEVSKEGFSKYLQSGIILQVGSNPTIDVALKVGTVSEQVQVEANAALVETRNAGIGQVIDNQRVLELPLNGRQVTELIFLSGMATQVNGAGLNSGVRNFPTVDISVAGGLSNGLTYRLDGGTHNDPYNNLNLPLPFPDALQEFKVETSALPAQYGHHSAAAVNGVTKSGTNEFHGDLFEFMRNGAVNAQNTFSKHVANSKDTLKRNQFGGTLGGRIIKNKLFFFVGEQNTLIRSFTPNNVANIPTAAMLQGDFSAVTVPQSCNTLKTRIQLKAPFDSSNHVSPSLFSPVALNIMKLSGFPSPSLATDVCGTFNFGRRNNSNQYDSLARADYQLSEKHFFFLRYLMAKLNAPVRPRSDESCRGHYGDFGFPNAERGVWRYLFDWTRNCEQFPCHVQPRGCPQNQSSGVFAFVGGDQYLGWSTRIDEDCHHGRDSTSPPIMRPRARTTQRILSLQTTSA